MVASALKKSCCWFILGGRVVVVVDVVVEKKVFFFVMIIFGQAGVVYRLKVVRGTYSVVVFFSVAVSMIVALVVTSVVYQ